jgi:hypothetical protein
VIPRANGLRSICCRAERERVGDVVNKGCATGKFLGKPYGLKEFWLKPLLKAMEELVLVTNSGSRLMTVFVKEAQG